MLRLLCRDGVPSQPASPRRHPEAHGGGGQAAVVGAGGPPALCPRETGCHGERDLGEGDSLLLLGHFQWGRSPSTAKSALLLGLPGEARLPPEVSSTPAGGLFQRLPAPPTSAVWPFSGQRARGGGRLRLGWPDVHHRPQPHRCPLPGGREHPSLLCRWDPSPCPAHLSPHSSDLGRGVVTREQLPVFPGAAAETGTWQTPPGMLSCLGVTWGLEKDQISYCFTCFAEFPTVETERGLQCSARGLWEAGNC